MSESTASDPPDYDLQMITASVEIFHSYARPVLPPPVVVPLSDSRSDATSLPVNSMEATIEQIRFKNNKLTSSY